MMLGGMEVIDGETDGLIRLGFLNLVYAWTHQVSLLLLHVGLLIARSLPIVVKNCCVCYGSLKVIRGSPKFPIRTHIWHRWPT